MSIQAKAILVWEFSNAPLEFQALSDNGGDEDWVIFVPDGVEAAEWIERLSPCPAPPKKVNGGTLFITAHA